MIIEAVEPVRPQPEDSRKPWIAPAVRATRAGDAEAGVEELIEEGVFADGS